MSRPLRTRQTAELSMRLLTLFLMAVRVASQGGDLLAPVSQPPETPFAPLRMPGDGPVVVCIITYQPFSFLMSSQDSIPAGVYAESDQSDFTGYDIELIEMLFGTDAGLDKRGVVYKAFPKRRLMWIALRNGECDFAASGITITDVRQDCSATCKRAPIPPPDFSLPPALQRLDYANETCCLDFSVPVKASSFSLLSKVRKKYSDILDLIFNIPVLNVVSTLITSTYLLSAVLWLSEIMNPRSVLHRPEICVYVVFMLLLGYGGYEPVSNMGRFVYVICTFNTIFSWTLLSSVITSSAVLADGFEIENGISSLAELGDAPLCVEPDYQLTNKYVESVNSSQATKINRQFGLFADCFRGVSNGTFTAFVTDGPMLRYELQKQGRSDMSAVDQNSEIYFGFAFNRGDTLKREAVSHLLLQLSSSVKTETASIRLREKWFPSHQPSPSSTELQYPSLITMSVGGLIALCLMLRTKWNKYRGCRQGQDVSLGMVRDFILEIIPFFLMVRTFFCQGHLHKETVQADALVYKPGAKSASFKGGKADVASLPATMPAGSLGGERAHHLSLDNTMERPNGRSVIAVSALPLLDAGGDCTAGGVGAGLRKRLPRPGSEPAPAAKMDERVREIALLQSELAVRVSELCALAQGAATEEEVQRAEDLGVDLPHGHAVARRATTDEVAAAPAGSPTPLLDLSAIHRV